MSSGGAKAGVSIHTRALWRLRARQELPRRLMHAAAAAGLIASARFAIAPPQATSQARPAAAKHADLAAEGFAALFARAYLTWQQDDPEARREALEPFTGSSLAPEAGMTPPARGSQRVIFEQVVQEREAAPDLRVYSIAAQTSTRGLVYLTVPVLRQPHGGLALAGYPAFVGPPSSAPADPLLGSGGEVEDPALRAVVARALRNYLAPAPDELAADLAPGADVSPLQQGLSLEAVQSLSWAPGGGRAVVAQVTAAGADGARYTLAYELDVLQVAGRWEISAIQMDANA